jgi:hypothetical protein
MKKACGTWFAVYLILAVVAGLLVYRRFPVPQVAAISGFFGGGALWLGFAYLWGIKKKFADSSMIRRALAGMPPVNGEKTAAIGRIEPVGSPMKSPLTRTACVAYKYEISRGYGDRKSVHYEGFALTPSMIQTQQGSIRLLAWTDLKDPSEDVPPEIAMKNAEEYIAATQFREPGAANIRAALGEMFDVYRDDDGTVRHDRMGAQPFAASKGIEPPVEMENDRYVEWLLRPGEPVCVIGTYSTERGGIVPSKEPIADPVTLERGEPHQFAGRQASGAVGYFIGGTIFIAASLVALILLYAFVPLDATEQMSPSFKASWDEVKLERIIEEKVRVPMRRFGMLNAAENTGVSLPNGAAIGRVRSGTADVTVSRVVARDEGEGRTFDIDDGTLTLTVDEKGTPTRLAIMRQEVPLGDAWIRVTGPLGRITYLADDRACHVTFNAYAE